MRSDNWGLFNRGDESMNGNIEKIAQKAIEIYFNYNISAEEAIKKAKEMILNEDTSLDKIKKAN